MKKLFKSKDEDQQGFSVVKIIILTVVVGLILIILFTVFVFIVIPQLQRNSRNTDRQTDIGAIRSGLWSYAADQEGTIPDDTTKLNTVLSVVDRIFYTDASSSALTNTAQTAFKIYIEKRSAVVTTDVLPDADSVHIIVGAECTTRGLTSTDGNRMYNDAETYDDFAGILTKTASDKAYVMLYLLEGNKQKLTCENS
ncbi:MAG: hypothetical protein OXF49_02760 [Candidatus Saccharibacteria bacterium]|nr:hypothetical protein [Candidatus Saccharibacteria bacterium]